MIRHIVMWKLPETAGGKTKLENAQQIKSMLEALVGVIEGLKKLEVGINISKSEHAYDICLYSEFDSPEALEAYDSHPRHLECRKFIRSVITDRAVSDSIL